MANKSLNVIALVSGGKDSFYSVLHCSRNGHRVVALANLYPGTGTVGLETGDSRRESGTESVEVDVYEPSLAQPSSAYDEHDEPVVDSQGSQDEPAKDSKAGHDDADAAGDTDLNSFMYQTVGHQIIPLYASATGIPLYRRRITGGAVQEARDYDGASLGSEGEGDETESMVPLLREVMRRHPDANAICAGAILSTYQRTRVESVAVRLGLVPLAFLWKYPILPGPPVGEEVPPEESEGLVVSVDGTSSALPDAIKSNSELGTRKTSIQTRSKRPDAALLLRDMACAGLDARIIKVASAGLDESFLWERISGGPALERARKALRRFGNVDGGAVIGEGGEFETLVVDGPPELFRRRIVIDEDKNSVVREGGGSAWLRIGRAKLETKEDGKAGTVRVPGILDEKFRVILNELVERHDNETRVGPDHRRLDLKDAAWSLDGGRTAEVYWSVEADQGRRANSIDDEAWSVVEKIRSRLENCDGLSCPPTAVTNVVILLRRMVDFPIINKIYGTLFPYANPPSRVTIACGDSLKEGCDIAIIVTLQRQLRLEDRSGLHVQSRSYWAPANIGPYSQAISVPIDPAVKTPKMTFIAGQIPLVPPTMELPETPEMPDEMQIVLSLQHLWRIGLEMKVQIWTSAVAYFSRAPGEDDMARRARLAARAWTQVHGEDDAEEEDDDETGPDLWDRRYNSEFMAYDQHQTDEQTGLPDWDVFKGPDERRKGPPPFYAVEVEELPRAASVEWHAHVGLADVEPGSVQMTWSSDFSDTSPVQVQHTIVNSSSGSSFIHSVQTHALDDDQNVAYTFPCNLGRVGDGVSKKVPAQSCESPYLVYVDVKRWDKSAEIGIPVIPCRSIWSGEGKRVKAVALFRCVGPQKPSP